MNQSLRRNAVAFGLATLAGSTIAAASPGTTQGPKSTQAAAARPGLAAGIDRSFAERWPARTMVAGKRMAHVRIERPEARASRALRVLNPGAPLSGVNALQEFTLNSVVMVRVEQASDMAGVLARQIAAGHTIVGSKAVGADGLRLAVQLRSVDAALAFAESVSSDPEVAGVMIDRATGVDKRTLPTDPYVSRQWHINNLLRPDADHDLSAVYDAGYSGAGVVVGVYEGDDSGFQRDHPDLAGNFRPSLSMTADLFEDDLTHGTAVGGLIAAVGNNGLGGTGVAFGAGLASMIGEDFDGPAGNAVGHIDAFLWRNDVIDIKNHSWGPIVLVQPFPLISVFEFPFVFEDSGAWANFDEEVDIAIRESARQGSKFVVAAGNDNLLSDYYRLAAGNGFLVNDLGVPTSIGFVTLDPMTLDFVHNADGGGFIGGRVEYDALARGRDVLAIGAIGEDNAIAPYSTSGTNVIAVAYSEGDSLRAITTTDQIDGDADVGCGILTDDAYTCSFNGTSASAPIASGIIALMLEANPNLTLRDIKFILQQTADISRIAPTEFTSGTAYASIEEELDEGNYIYRTGATAGGGLTPTLWQVSGGDVPHSDLYGFGVIDADDAVAAAENYGGSPNLLILDTGLVAVEDGEVEDASYEEYRELQSFLQVNDGWSDQLCIRPNIQIEEVELTITISGRGNGDLGIFLVSPRGTSSPMHVPHADYSWVGINGVEYAMFNARFNSFKHWGELSSGEWDIFVDDYGVDTDDYPAGELDDSDPPQVIPHIVDLGPGIPGSADNTQKAVVSYRLRIYGHDVGAEPSQVCSPINTGQCPADVTGDGNVDSADLLTFLQWWLDGSVFADLNGDGFVDTLDLIAFVQVWLNTNGPCTRDPATNGPNEPIGGGTVINI